MIVTLAPALKQNLIFFLEKLHTLVHTENQGLIDFANPFMSCSGTAHLCLFIRGRVNWNGLMPGTKGIALTQVDKRMLLQVGSSKQFQICPN